MVIAVIAPENPVQAQRYVIADQDAAGPGGSGMTSLLVLLQSPDVKVLGITVVTGDGWREPEVHMRFVARDHWATFQN